MFHRNDAVKNRGDAVQSDFFDTVAAIIEQARTHVGRTADLTMCVTYFEIGRMIVEREQNGKDRAEYGRGLLKELAAYLTARFDRGFSLTNLKYAKQFYLAYSPAIRQLLTAESNSPKGQTMSDLFEKGQLSTGQSELLPIRQSLISELGLFKLSWSHYQVLMRIKNDSERRFYEIEAANQL